MFISGLAAAFGTQKVSALILQHALGNSAFRKILHGLGYQLSINEWMKDAEDFVQDYNTPVFIHGNNILVFLLQIFKSKINFKLAKINKI